MEAVWVLRARINGRHSRCLVQLSLVCVVGNLYSLCVFGNRGAEPVSLGFQLGVYCRANRCWYSHCRVVEVAKCLVQQPHHLLVPQAVRASV